MQGLSRSGPGDWANLTGWGSWVGACLTVSDFRAGFCDWGIWLQLLMEDTKYSTEGTSKLVYTSPPTYFRDTDHGLRSMRYQDEENSQQVSISGVVRVIKMIFRRPCHLHRRSR
jgi:hypothetical protein